MKSKSFNEGSFITVNWGFEERRCCVLYGSLKPFEANAWVVIGTVEINLTWHVKRTCAEGFFFSILQETPGTYSVIHSPCGRSSRFPIQFKGQQNTWLKVQQVLQFELFSWPGHDLKLFVLWTVASPPAGQTTTVNLTVVFPLFSHFLYFKCKVWTEFMKSIMRELITI